MIATVLVPLALPRVEPEGAAEARKLCVGEILIRLREHRKLTQEELARDLGISASYLSLLENGKRPATRRVLRTLANYLRVPAAYVVLQDLRLEALSERHRAIVKELRCELVEPAFRNLFASNQNRSG
jgi:XRE family transcriptional regulator, fatty acid utilization regulator